MARVIVDLMRFITLSKPFIMYSLLNSLPASARLPKGCFTFQVSSASSSDSDSHVSSVKKKKTSPKTQQNTDKSDVSFPYCWKASTNAATIFVSLLTFLLGILPVRFIWGMCIN